MVLSNLLCVTPPEQQTGTPRTLPAPILLLLLFLFFPFLFFNDLIKLFLKCNKTRQWG